MPSTARPADFPATALASWDIHLGGILCRRSHHTRRSGVRPRSLPLTALPADRDRGTSDGQRSTARAATSSAGIPLRPESHSPTLIACERTCGKGIRDSAHRVPGRSLAAHVRHRDVHFRSPCRRRVGVPSEPVLRGSGQRHRRAATSIPTSCASKSRSRTSRPTSERRIFLNIGNVDIVCVQHEFGSSADPPAATCWRSARAESSGRHDAAHDPPEPNADHNA